MTLEIEARLGIKDKQRCLGLLQQSFRIEILRKVGHATEGSCSVVGSSLGRVGIGNDRQGKQL